MQAQPVQPSPDAGFDRPAHARAPFDFSASDMAAMAATPAPPLRTATYSGVAGLGGENSSAADEQTPAGPTLPAAGPAANRQMAISPAAAPTAVPRRRGPWLSIVVIFLVVVSASEAVVHFKVCRSRCWRLDETRVVPHHVGASGATVTLDGRTCLERRQQPSRSIATGGSRR